jgi:hypothetical protein
MTKNSFKAPQLKVPASPAHDIASQFKAVKPQGQEAGYKADRDMYEVSRSQDFLAKNPYGITYGNP